VILPVADVGSLPKLLLDFVTARSENAGAENCWVLVLTTLFLMPYGAVRRLTPSSVIALRDTSAKPDAEQHLVARCSLANLEQRHHFFFLVDVAGGPGSPPSR